MSRYRSKPSEIEAVQWTGGNWDEVEEFAGVRVTWTGQRNERCSILAGPEGESGWVDVTTGTWIARDVETGDDYWPLSNGRMVEKYEPAWVSGDIG